VYLFARELRCLCHARGWQSSAGSAWLFAAAWSPKTAETCWA